MTPKHKMEINALVRSTFRKGEISSKKKDYLTSDSAQTARFYMLPKINKNNIPTPGRPIVSRNGCPTEKMSLL